MSFPYFNLNSFGRFSGHTFFALIALGGAAWTGTALSLHLTGTVFWISLVALIVAAIAAFGVRFYKRRLGWLTLVAVTLLVGIWYQSINPSHDRDWAIDVAHGAGAQVVGDIVELTNVRNFEWQSPTDAVQSWEARTLDLTKLETVDMVTSVWDNPDIAHLLVSFGFSDGQRVAFSVETRKEAHEVFSIKGGFFRQFELVLIAATEDDIIKLRTNYRQEDVRLYPVQLNLKQRRDLFMSYVDLAQELQAEPKFYNTLTENCTTTVYGLAKVVKPDLALDWRLVLSGHLPDYVDSLGAFDDDLSIEERIELAQITPKALSYEGSDFSAAIRQSPPTQ